MISHFGTTKTGEQVQKLTIGTGDLAASILSHGIALQDVRLKGVPHSLTLGFQTLAPYEAELYHAGTLMGPVANRIQNAQATIDGTTHHFEKNFQNAHTLHGASAATHAINWTIKDHSPNHVTLTTTLNDGMGGFPGTRHLTAEYQTKDTTLSLKLTATTDKPTWMNLANHSYWNLGPNPTTKGHTLTVNADHYLPGDPITMIPTGEIAKVENTRFDYRTPRKIESGAEGLLDNTFCLSTKRESIRQAATLTGPTGITMKMATTEPGLQVFDGHITAMTDAHTTDAAPPKSYAALALEAQFWPNAPNTPSFPDITLRPNQPWQHHTTWTFTKA